MKEENMHALLFIILVVGLGMLVSCQVSPEITWFEYYKGGVTGLFTSGVVLDILARKKRRDEIEMVVQT
jgi:hypothetical protein